MSKLIFPELSQLNLPDNINFPFFIQANNKVSDALSDFYIGYSHCINYICEVLLLNQVGKSVLKENEVFKPILKYGYKNEDVAPCPTITIKNIDESIGLHSLSENLFNLSLSQIVSYYDLFLNQLTLDILVRNKDILAIEELQLTTKTIFSLENLENMVGYLAEKKALEHAMLSYPKRVEVFERMFHVGIHSKKSPVTLELVHDIIEVRNVIVHNDGYASSLYFARLSPYIKNGYKPLLKDEYDTKEIDFIWLIRISTDLLKLAIYIDEQASLKWTTTRNIQDKNEVEEKEAKQNAKDH